MALEFSTLSEFARHGFDALVDVRSPAEFAEDHIPGAISLPVLSDEERARVGTIYVQDSAFRARKIGAAIVARNAARHIETALADHDGGWRPLVYCWRGGQRSGSFASILSQIGWRAETVAGGYRSFRRLVTRALYDVPWPCRVILLDGNTGTGKTEVLGALRRLGIQVLDLEGLAKHRGSVLGATGRPQPSQKAFETGIAMCLQAFDPKLPVIVEAESSKVGNVMVPPMLWKAMRAAPRIVIAAPEAERAAFLARVYADSVADTENFAGALRQLLPYHGRERVEAWQSLLADGALEALAGELIAIHYDPRYSKSRERRDGSVLAEIRAERLDPAGIGQLAREIAGILRQA